MSSLNETEIGGAAPILGNIQVIEAALVEIEEEILEILDIEAHAHTGRRKPKARLYRFRVGKTECKVSDPLITGAEILTLADKLPPEKYILRQVMHGGELKLIGLKEIVDLRAPGIERFRAMPRTAQDG